jgi:hypothetical protein
MNCQEYESRTEGRARGALADAGLSAEASAHEESCAPCAARLADERALSTGLRALAAGTEGAGAPARTEASLLAAFRARPAAAGGEDSGRATSAGNVVPLAAPAPLRRWSWAKTAAVASLAAAASLALFVLVRPGAVGDRRAMIEPPPGTSGAKAAPQAARQDAPRVFEGAAPSQSVSPLEVGEVGPEAHDALRDRAPRPTFSPRARPLNASYGAGGGRPARPAADASAQEIATEFIPLTQGGQYAQAEEGHLVRLELPRSALASFGLPVNAEAGGRVKADVLLGEDGTARAIRFIR